MTGAELITQERRRQIDDEHFTLHHDDNHNLGELPAAAISYIAAALRMPNTSYRFWPWRYEDFKPAKDNPIATLVKAGALIAAEIDRLQRAATH